MQGLQEIIRQDADAKAAADAALLHKRFSLLNTCTRLLCLEQLSGLTL